MVEIEGERVLAASCIRKPAPDMEVKTATERAVKARRMVIELLLADQPPREDSPDRVSPFWHWAEAAWTSTSSRFPAHDIDPSPTCPIPRWRSISMPASIAGCACVPAARSRSTT